MGILGLVVDVGWGYYRKQVAQAAVDSAVMAAVVAAGTGTITCGSGGVVCKPSGISCASATDNLLAGCQYGAENGIANANMTIAADLSSNTPLTGVSVNLLGEGHGVGTHGPYVSTSDGIQKRDRGGYGYRRSGPVG